MTTTIEEQQETLKLLLEAWNELHPQVKGAFLLAQVELVNPKYDDPPYLDYTVTTQPNQLYHEVMARFYKTNPRANLR